MIVKLLTMVVVVGMVDTMSAISPRGRDLLDAQPAPVSATPVVQWRQAVVRALTAAGPGTSHFSSDAGVYAGIVHLAIYDPAAELAASPEASPQVTIDDRPDLTGGTTRWYRHA
jgi:hypothetical protein